MAAHFRLCIHNNNNHFTGIFEFQIFQRIPETPQGKYPVKCGPQSKIIRNSSINEMDIFMLCNILIDLYITHLMK